MPTPRLSWRGGEGLVPRQGAPPPPPGTPPPMPPRLASAPGNSSVGFLLRGVRLGLLFVPVSLLFAASLRAPEHAAGLLWLGTLFQALACLLAVLTRQGWREPAGPALI